MNLYTSLKIRIILNGFLECQMYFGNKNYEQTIESSLAILGKLSFIIVSFKFEAFAKV